MEEIIGSRPINVNGLRGLRIVTNLIYQTLTEDLPEGEAFGLYILGRILYKHNHGDKGLLWNSGQGFSYGRGRAQRSAFRVHGVPGKNRMPAQGHVNPGRAGVKGRSA